jgi:hypothetical protein
MGTFRKSLELSGFNYYPEQFQDLRPNAVELPQVRSVSIGNYVGTCYEAEKYHSRVLARFSAQRRNGVVFVVDGHPLGYVKTMAHGAPSFLSWADTTVMVKTFLFSERFTD